MLPAASGGSPGEQRRRSRARTAVAAKRRRRCRGAWADGRGPAGGYATGEQPLFPGVTEAELWRAHRPARAAIGRPGLTIKDLRHVAAIAWNRAGVNMVRIKDYLGHATLSQTARYAHYAPDQAEEADLARRIARQLRGTAATGAPTPPATEE
jgi:integrase